MTLSAENVSVRRDGRLVLADVTAAIRPCEILAILGPNGAGKSTLFAALAGDMTPASGRVAMDGQDVRSFSIAARAARRAVLRQTTVMSFGYPAGEVVAMGLHPRGLDRRGARGRRILDATIAATGVEPFLARPVTTLSGGEAQRVHLARVLAQIWPDTDEPPVHRYLLLDEPTASLDVRQQQDVVRAVRRVAETGVGVAMVVHDPALAARAADRVLLLRNGRAQGEARAVSACDRDSIAALYGVDAEAVSWPAAA